MSPKLPLSILTGKTIMERWDCNEKQLVSILQNGLIRNAYKSDPAGIWDYMPGDQLIEISMEYYEPFAELYYSADDVYSLEASFPKLIGGKWKEDIISVAELEQSWGRPAIEITDLLSNSEINPVDPTGGPLDRGVMFTITEDYDFVSYSDWLYLRSEVAEVEKTYSIKPKSENVKKLRPNQRHKLKCRELAKEIWKENPYITIAYIISKNEIKDACDGKAYDKKVLRDWIKDLCPNRKPGRPKKNKPV